MPLINNDCTNTHDVMNDIFFAFIAHEVGFDMVPDESRLDGCVLFFNAQNHQDVSKHFNCPKTKEFISL
jgi:hypothetical protein